MLIVLMHARLKIHEDQATKDWFYPALAAEQIPASPDMAKAFIALLDSPNRVILEHEPVKFIS